MFVFTIVCMHVQRQAAQCVGRVIRSKADYGMMIFADKRFVVFSFIINDQELVKQQSGVRNVLSKCASCQYVYAINILLDKLLNFAYFAEFIEGS